MIALQQPTLIEELDLEQLFNQRQQALIQAYNDLSNDKNAPAAVHIKEAIAQPSDPLHQLLRVEAYRELMLRQRINETMRGHLLAFATGRSLDQLGQNYGMVRHTNEQDDDFRERIRGNIQGTHTAGTKAYYASLAAAHPFVRDVNVEKGRPGEVVVSVKPLNLESLLKLKPQENDDQQAVSLLERMAQEPDMAAIFMDRTLFVEWYAELTKAYPHRYLPPEVHPLFKESAAHQYSATAAASALMMPCVAAMMNEDDKKMLTDRIRVEVAQATTVIIRARLHFKPGIGAQTENTIKLHLQQHFKQAFEQAANLGWQVAPSWIYNTLAHADVVYIELIEPTTVIQLPFNAYAQLPEAGLQLEQ